LGPSPARTNNNPRCLPKGARVGVAVSGCVPDEFRLERAEVQSTGVWEMNGLLSGSIPYSTARARDGATNQPTTRMAKLMKAAAIIS
jgi:hypothetical protein